MLKSIYLNQINYCYISNLHIVCCSHSYSYFIIKSSFFQCWLEYVDQYIYVHILSRFFVLNCYQSYLCSLFFRLLWLSDDIQVLYGCIRSVLSVNSQVVRMYGLVNMFALMRETLTWLQLRFASLFSLISHIWNLCVSKSVMLCIV